MPEPRIPDKLAILLDPDEVVIHAVKKMPSLEKPKWLVVTSKRIIVFDEKILGRYEMKSIPFERLARVYFRRGLLSSEFVIEEEDGSKTVLGWMDKKAGEEAIQAISRAISQASVEPPAVARRKGLIAEEIILEKPREALVRSRVVAAQPQQAARDPYEELLKLKRLLDKGVITEEEYRELREAVLERIRSKDDGSS